MPGERAPAASSAARPRGPSSSGAAPASSSSGAAPAVAPPRDVPTLFAGLQPELTRCYEVGAKTTPEMTDGKLTLNATIDAHGAPECVIPSDHTGLTQEVEDCMSERFAAQRFEPGAPWSVSVPVVVRAGVVLAGQRAPDTALLESVETLRMPDAFDVLESLEPALQSCVRAASRSGGAKSVLVGARVGADGRPQCALATSRGAVAAEVTGCAASVLRGAKFPPPKRGSGLVLVPIGVGSAR
jgi:hypothetical protein